MIYVALGLLIFTLLVICIAALIGEAMINRCPVCRAPMNEWDSDSRHDWCSNPECPINKIDKRKRKS